MRTVPGEAPLPRGTWLIKRYFIVRAIQFSRRGADRRNAILTVQCRLKNCTARSCFSAAAREWNVPRLRRLPVFGSILREYSRNLPDESLRIMDGSSKGLAGQSTVRTCTAVRRQPSSWLPMYRLPDQSRGQG